MLLVVNIFYFHHEYIINFGSAALGEREREREIRILDGLWCQSFGWSESKQSYQEKKF